MSNRYYTTFQERCQELEKLMGQYQPKKDNQGEADKKSKKVVAKKLRGALAVELLRQEINTYLESEGEPFKASTMNSYIAGSGYEYDLRSSAFHGSWYLEQLVRSENLYSYTDRFVAVTVMD